MALTCNFSTYISSFERYGSTSKPFRKALQHKHSHISIKTIPALKIRSSSFRNKVFEDQSAGIICYKDENGDLICEGFDEGPRYHQKIHKTGTHMRDADEMFDLIQQGRFDFVMGKELNPVIEDINCNGFNTLR